MACPKLSIILPVYNVERFLPACLDSIYQQGVEESVFEVICVNDCSSDNSKDIILAFTKKHNNLKYIEHPKNEATGKSRNDGLKNATGQYVWFVDPDDRIADGCLCRMIELCINQSLDMLAFNFQRVFNNGQVRDNGFFFDNSPLVEGKDLILTKFGKDFIYYLLGFSWLYIYRRELLLHNNLFFPEGCYHEDASYACNALLLSKRVLSISEVCYLYRYNEDSATIQLATRKSGRQVFDNIFFSGDLVEKLGYNFSKFNADYCDVLYNYARDDYYNRLWIMYLPLPYKEKKVFASLVRKNKSLVFEKKKQMTLINRLFATDRIPLISYIATPAYRCAKLLKKLI